LFLLWSLGLLRDILSTTLAPLRRRKMDLLKKSQQKTAHSRILATV